MRSWSGKVVQLVCANGVIVYAANKNELPGWCLKARYGRCGGSLLMQGVLSK